MKKIRLTIPNDYQSQSDSLELANWMDEHVGPDWNEADIWAAVWSRLPDGTVLVSIDDFSATYLVPEDWQPDDLPPLWMTIDEEVKACDL